MANPLVLDLGCGKRKHEGAIGTDNVRVGAVDLVHNLKSFPYPFTSACADEVILSHVLEHFSVQEISPVLEEVWRILKPEGVVTISVPHALSAGFYADPTHISHFTFETFHYFTESHQFNYYKDTVSNWQVQRLWASVNLLSNLHAEDDKWVKKLNGFFSRGLSYVVRRSFTAPDLLVKCLPIWLVSIHCRLAKAA
jgi:predicted SAM-dependent methyltransferase